MKYTFKVAVMHSLAIDGIGALCFFGCPFIYNLSFCVSVVSTSSGVSADGFSPNFYL